MLKGMTIKRSLISVLGVLIVCLIALGVASVISLGDAKQSLRTVYEDRLVAMGQLDQVIRAEERVQFVLAAAIIDNANHQNDYSEQVKALSQLSDENWQQYMATYLTDEEQVLAKEFAIQREKYKQQILSSLKQALQKKETELARQILLNDAGTSFQAMRTQLDKLITLQLNVAQAEYQHGVANYQQQLRLVGLILGLALILCVLSGRWLLTTISSSLSHAIDLAQHVAQGDLTREIQAHNGNETGQLLQALDQMNQGLTDIVLQVRNGADLIDQASVELAQGNLDLSQRTESQASHIEETASAIEQMTAAVQLNAENAEHANRLASQACEQTRLAGAAVTQVVHSMSEIKQQSSKVADIIGVIDGIAFQTNILALNAAVEAARAGEQGRGFAVVASEVRNLAQRSATAARDIKCLISESGSTIAQGDSDALGAGKTMQEVLHSVEQVASLLNQISSASKEQSQGIAQINQVVAEMEQTTQQNAALVEQASAATLSLQSQANQLSSLVSQFQLKKSSITPIASSHGLPQRKSTATSLALPASRAMLA